MYGYPNSGHNEKSDLPYVTCIMDWRGVSLNG